MHSVLLIQSKDRLSGTHNNFTVKLPNPYSNVRAIKLLSAFIPNTVYNITSSNNTFIFNEGGSNLTATLTAGAYSVFDLVTELETKLDAAGANTYTVSYSAVTFKLTITSTANYTIIGGTILNILGFEAQLVAGLTFSSTYAVRLHIPKSYMVQIKELANDNVRTTASNQYSNFIITSQVNSSDIDYHYHNTHYNVYVNSNIPTLTQLSISIFDENGSLLDLNGSDWAFMVQFYYNGYEDFVHDLKKRDDCKFESPYWY